MTSFLVDGNLPQMIIKANSADEALEIFMEFTKLNEITVKKFNCNCKPDDYSDPKSHSINCIGIKEVEQVDF